MNGAGRITLDRPRPEDARSVARMLQSLDPVTAGLAFGRQDASTAIAEAGPQDHAIRVAGEFAGVVGTSGDRLRIWIEPPFQRSGVAMRASVLALSRAFVAGTTKVAASHAAADPRSALLLARLGFKEKSRRSGPGVIHLTLGGADFAARHPVAIRTSRLMIDAVRPADMAVLHRVATRPEVARMLLRFRPGMTEQALAALFPDEALVPPFRLVARHNGVPAGTIGIGSGATPDIYYFIDPDRAGGGLATEMVQGFATEVIDRYGFAALMAEVFEDNPASRRVLEKTGFQVAERIMLRSVARDGPAPAWRMRRDA